MQHSRRGKGSIYAVVESDDKKSTDNPIFLKQFVNGKQALLHDTFLNKDIIVEISGGAPVCKNCNLNDCAHVDLLYAYSSYTIVTVRKTDAKHELVQLTEGEFQYAPLRNQGEGKIGTTGRTIWDGLFDAVPDLTNREESIFADTEGNVCTEVVLYC